MKKTRGFISRRYHVWRNSRGRSSIASAGRPADQLSDPHRHAQLGSEWAQQLPQHLLPIGRLLSIPSRGQIFGKSTQLALKSVHHMPLPAIQGSVLTAMVRSAPTHSGSGTMRGDVNPASTSQRAQSSRVSRPPASVASSICRAKMAASGGPA
jgi:hypothetical protein